MLLSQTSLSGIVHLVGILNSLVSMNCNPRKPHMGQFKNKAVRLRVNPTWTRLFSDLKRLTGAKCPSPPNLAISSQMTMKLGRDIPMVEIFIN